MAEATKDQHLSIRISDEAKRKVALAAQLSGRNVNDWARRELERAADAVIDANSPRVP